MRKKKKKKNKKERKKKILESNRDLINSEKGEMS